MPDPIGYTKRKIMELIPEIKYGSFDKIAALAQVFPIGQKASSQRPHILVNVYPPDAVRKMREAVSKIKGNYILNSPKEF